MVISHRNSTRNGSKTVGAVMVIAIAISHIVAAERALTVHVDEIIMIDQATSSWENQIVTVLERFRVRGRVSSRVRWHYRHGAATLHHV